MSNHKPTIELISTFTCKRCHKAQQQIKKVLSKLDSNTIEYKEINVLNQLDYVVSLGVLSTPAIAINGKLRFHTIPSEKEMMKAFQKLIDEANHV